MLARESLVIYSYIVLILIYTRINTLYRLNLIMVRAAADSPSEVSMLFGMQQTIGAAARAIAPGFASALYAFSTEKQVFGGYFVWIVLVALSFAIIPPAMWTRDAPAPNAAAKKATSSSSA